MDDGFDLVDISWGARHEVPLQLADRFLDTVRHLNRLGPVFDGWRWLESIRVHGEEESGRLIPLAETASVLARAIEHNVSCEDYRSFRPAPDQGYFLLAASRDDGEPNYVHVSATAGSIDSSCVFAFANRANICFAANGAQPTIVTFDTAKSLLLLMTETWEASSGIAFPNGDFDMALAGKAFKWGWMTYLSPYFATRIEPPTGIVLEYRPNGGLFMAATTDVFDPNKLVHYEAAQRIRRALEPLNALPFPVDQPYR